MVMDNLNTHVPGSLYETFAAPRNLGRWYRALGELALALSFLQEALRISPYGARNNYEMALTYMALTYEVMGRTEEARTHLDRAIEAWAVADSTYKWAQRAREAAERMGGW